MIHQKTCPHSMINCKHCQSRLKRSESETHLKTCSMVPIKCKYCKKVEFTKFNMSKHKEHEMKCQREEVSCPYGCGANKILRNQLFLHYCCLTPMPCKYAPRCKVVLPSQDYALHIYNCDEQPTKCHM